MRESSSLATEVSEEMREWAIEYRLSSVWGWLQVPACSKTEGFAGRSVAASWTSFPLVPQLGWRYVVDGFLGKLVQKVEAEFVLVEFVQKVKRKNCAEG